MASAACLAQLHHEAMEPAVLAIGVELRKDQGVCARIHARRPPFERRESRAVDFKLLCVDIKGSGRFQSTDVGAVAQLCEQ